jgi:uncharacterized membrane protein
VPKPYLLHPAVVHFPLALLLTGLVGACAAAWRKRPAWLNDAVSWLLWLGTASAWAALALGMLAKRTAPHVPPAWEALDLHETLGYWTAGSFTALSVWRRFFSQRAPAWFLLAWLAAAAVLCATGYYGGELVFTHNMGTAASVEQ